MRTTTHRSAHSAMSHGGVKAVAVGALALALVATLPAPAAQAHAGLTGSSPRDGAQLSAAPKAVTLTFSEQVSFTPSNIQLLNAAASQVSVKVTQKVTSGRSKITVTPSRLLPAGRYAARYSVTSADGHVVAGAIAFSVKTPTASAGAQTRRLTNGVSATLSGAKVGSRTLTMKTSAKSGTVELTHPSLGAPLRWKVTGNGTSAKARGMLPFSGNWTVTARLRISQYDESVGTATFAVGR